MKLTKHVLTAGMAIVSLSALAAEPDLSKLPPASSQKDVTYAKDIQSIFKGSCLGCHGEERHKADLRLDSLEGVLKGSKDGQVVVPGKSEKSDLVIAIARLDPDTAMPPMRKPGGRGPGGPPPGSEKRAEHGSTNGPAGGPPQGGPGGGNRPMPKPLTAEQVGLVRAWIDQGAK
ncbi:c-type cytochrome domain-containing protein [Pedosphaera parvula]|uniref:Planctomycete cytochrome C n=1 Tax=Pedosphaera parvula (strain Ellin514) TaxID=320771 RepID=B9XQW5_PEDPL|nr:c-type cytochrome domain-containing protein [Pedosphaera parvula]EEF57742.1 Planctomycete cytochrome C [Pedosphaera parvula Ellin514]